MSLKAAIRAAASERDAVKLESQQEVITAEERTISLTIKVTKSQRLHWLIAAKRQNTSLTAAIVDALNTRFGEPE